VVLCVRGDNTRSGKRYMREHNVPQEALAAMVATQSEHAALKWSAMLRDVASPTARRPSW
jgi:hypothetical protein